mgnify:CR=1 FL=1
MNGLGSSIRWPPMVVAPSAMASSMADWVFALARLISSSNTKLAWIGPICVVKRWGGEIEHLGSHKVRRHEVRRALHAFERTGDGGGQRLCGCRLRQAGHRFYENMPPATKVVIRILADWSGRQAFARIASGCCRPTDRPVPHRFLRSGRLGTGGWMGLAEARSVGRGKKDMCHLLCLSVSYAVLFQLVSVMHGRAMGISTQPCSVLVFMCLQLLPCRAIGRWQRPVDRFGSHLLECCGSRGRRDVIRRNRAMPTAGWGVRI